MNVKKLIENKLIWKTELGWNRLCPKCNSIIEHKGKYSKYVCSMSYKTQKTCNSCSGKLKIQHYHPMLGKHHSQETKEKLSKIHTGRKCYWLKGKERPQKVKEQISLSSKGKIMSDEFKEKCRIKRQKQVELLGGGPVYNPKSCEYINKLNNYGYNFQHALNGGEISICGYWVDGYDKEKNIVFEYDEKQHLSPSHKNKDLIKQKNIISSINPRMFIRYDEKNNRLYDVITNANIPIIL